MKSYLKNDFYNNTHFVHVYSNISQEALEQKIHEVLTSAKYKLILGSDANGTYEKGNYTKRLLLGAFYKYFKFSIVTGEDNNELKVSVKKLSSGMSGGLIGMDQVKKEMNSIAQMLSEL